MMSSERYLFTIFLILIIQLTTSNKRFARPRKIYTTTATTNKLELSNTSNANTYHYNDTAINNISPDQQALNESSLNNESFCGIIDCRINTNLQHYNLSHKDKFKNEIDVEQNKISEQKLFEPPSNDIGTVIRSNDNHLVTSMYLSLHKYISNIEALNAYIHKIETKLTKQILLHEDITKLLINIQYLFFSLQNNFHNKQLEIELLQDKYQYALDLLLNQNLHYTNSNKKNNKKNKRKNKKPKIRNKKKNYKILLNKQLNNELLLNNNKMIDHLTLNHTMNSSQPLKHKNDSFIKSFNSLIKHFITGYNKLISNIFNYKTRKVYKPSKIKSKVNMNNASDSKEAIIILNNTTKILDNSITSSNATISLTESLETYDNNDNLLNNNSVVIAYNESIIALEFTLECREQVIRELQEIIERYELEMIKMSEDKYKYDQYNVNSIKEFNIIDDDIKLLKHPTSVNTNISSSMIEFTNNNNYQMIVDIKDISDNVNSNNYTELLLLTLNHSLKDKEKLENLLKNASLQLWYQRGLRTPFENPYENN